jgi:hypothetical protein
MREQLYADLRGKKPEWLRAEAVPTLTQMLMAEDALTRRLLVELLAKIPGKQSTVALASRAAFDLAPAVRAAALEALKNRSAEDYRPVLLEALRYPWAPPADFAAEALAHLKDTGAISDLVVFLKMPPASYPETTGKKRPSVREVVRISHVHNCQLCHPPSLAGRGLVRAEDPINKIILPPSQTHIGGGGGGGGYGGGGGGRTITGKATEVPQFIRADITFLRQDFSVALPRVIIAGKFAPVARFDFVVRKRYLDRAELAKWKTVEQRDPQRDAVLFALRELTGRDVGNTTQAWVKAFPRAEAEVRSRRLVETLVKGGTLERAGLLTRYRDAEGHEYTLALGRAVTQLRGPSQEIARIALVKRLARQSASELRTYLADSNPEIRYAAIRACGEKGDRELVADLAALKGDTSTKTLANAAMKKLAE